MPDDTDFPMAVPFLFPGIAGVRCLFSTAPAGDMAAGEGRRERARRNRLHFMRLAGFDRWAETVQVHGDALVPAEGDPDPMRGGDAKADGLHTAEKRVGLTIRTADCQPVLLASRDGGAVAALHVGWRGNAMNFPGSAVARLCEAFSCPPADLVAVRGPSLGPTASEFVNFADEWPPGFLPWYNREDRTVNLWALTRHQLEAAGLRPERIHSLDMCTRTMAGWFFSYRRGDAGRQVAAIWME